VLSAPAAQAADHGDGAGVGALMSAGDIADVFSWMNADASKINLVMTFKPSADTTTEFSDAVQYNFRLASYPSFISTLTGTMPGAKSRVTCTFSTDQKISCWVVNGTDTVDYVTGDASATTGISSDSGKIKVFAGLRNDPFFFNLAGFRQATAAVYSAVAGGLAPDPTTGCFDLGSPTDPASTAAALIGLLTSDCTGGADGVDFFSPMTATSNANCPTDDTYFINQPFSGNVLAIAVQIDKTLVTDATNNVLAVWASTNMP
jgi:hypothetical protein